jgi:hypothetical protein
VGVRLVECNLKDFKQRNNVRHHDFKKLHISCTHVLFLTKSAHAELSSHGLCSTPMLAEVESM